MIKIDKKYIIKYSFEFVVIVLGISVSFWLNELSIDNQNEVERVKVLNSLKMEIQEIRNYTDEREKTCVHVSLCVCGRVRACGECVNFFVLACSFSSIKN